MPWIVECAIQGRDRTQREALASSLPVSISLTRRWLALRPLLIARNYANMQIAQNE